MGKLGLAGVGFSAIVAMCILSLVPAFAGKVAGEDSGPLRSQADTNREVIRTFAEVAVAEKDYAEAESLLITYLAQDPVDPQLWSLLASVQLSQKKFAQAVHSSRKAVDLTAVTHLDYSLRLYLFADALFQGGRSADAISVLKQVRKYDPSTTESVDATLTSIRNGSLSQDSALPPLNRVPVEPKFRLAIALSSGFDSNVLLVDDLSAGRGVSNQGSFFLSPSLMANTHGKVFDQRWDARLLTSFTSYTEEAAQGFNLMYQRADFLWGSKSRWRWGAFQEMSLLNRDSYQLYFLNGGAQGQFRHRPNANTEWRIDLPLRYRYYSLDQDGAAENNRTGPDLTARFQFLRVFADDIRFSTAASLSQAWTEGKNFRLFEFFLPNQLILPLPWTRQWGLLHTFGVELGGQSYWASESGRRDWSVRGSVGVIKSLGSQYRVSLDYSYLKNFSILETARFRKHLITLSISADLW